MKVVNPSVEILRTGLETEFVTPEQFIEKVGRTCYKSEDKITDSSAAKFVSGLVKRGHEAMIEHWNLIFETDANWYEEILSDWDILMHNINSESANKKILRPHLRFSDCEYLEGMRFIVSGNMRAWRDYAKACITVFGFIPQYLYGVVRNHPLFFPEFQEYIPAIINNTVLIPIEVRELSKAERRIHQTVTVKIVCDRGVSHEIVRHRVASFAQESTRYCNYGLDKFGNEITVVRPSWCDEDSVEYGMWMYSCQEAEVGYFRLIDAGRTPQEARSVLPNSLKTEIIVTMDLDGWEHFFGLRCAPDAQPDMREVAQMANELFEHERVFD